MSEPEKTDDNHGNAGSLWMAVATRDTDMDGRFFYGVKTTGIYCRPSCGARTPKQENVTFFASAREAEQAGFRPCRRCWPRQPPLAQRHRALVARLCREMAEAETQPTLAALARRAGTSPSHLRRLFKAATGLTPKAYGNALRAAKIRQALERGDNVTDAIYAAGFNSNSRFYEQAEELLGMSAGSYRAKGRDIAIRFAVGRSSLGAVLVAASEQGVCAIFLGDDPDTLVRNLQDRFPDALLHGGDGDFEHWVAVVIGLVEAPGTGLDLPLDIRGTAFQQRVWQALRAIPPGTTVSYGELADKLGMPSAARAVASACAANPLAVAIPCHRVVRRDGGLSGYRWGVERKRQLLKREGRRKKGA